MVSRREVDEALTRLRSGTAMLSAALLDLDARAENVLGDVTRLRGRTATRAAVARAGLDWLWARHRALRAVLARADALRADGSRPGGRQVGRIDALLRQPALPGPDPAPAGLAAGTAVTAASASAVCPGDLLAGTAEIAAAIGAELSAVVEARAEHHRELVTAVRELAEVGAVCARLGVPDLPELLAARSAVDAAAAAVAANPLEVTPAELTPAVEAVTRAGDLVTVLRRAFDGLDDELAAAEELLHRVVSVALAGEQAARTVVEHLTGDLTGLVGLGDGWFDDPRHGLRPWLDRLRAAGAAGEWRLVAHGLRAWNEVAGATLTAAEKVVETNTAPLRRRDELRGLLGALRAKAGRQGRFETPEITAPHERAAGALHTVPVDLDAAAALVRAFGDALIGSPAAPPAASTATPPAGPPTTPPPTTPPPTIPPAAAPTTPPMAPPTASRAASRPRTGQPKEECA